MSSQRDKEKEERKRKQREKERLRAARGGQVGSGGVVKRGRGRPKKNPTVVDALATAAPTYGDALATAAPGYGDALATAAPGLVTGPATAPTTHRANVGGFNTAADLGDNTLLFAHRH
jgi:hypothetical protein